MNLVFRIVLLIGGLSLPTLALANDLSGFWQVEDQPAWIEIQTGMSNRDNVTKINRPTVFGDRNRIRQLIENLVDNAAKFMGDQSTPRIEIGTRLNDRETTFYVRDNGVGIDPRYHRKVFELFDKLDAKSNGTGVGLAIVKRIVEVHGGRIWVESEGTGKGSTFCFTIPEG